MNTAYLYSDAFHRFDYGANHPLKTFRLKLTHELIKACGLLAPDDPRVIVLLLRSGRTPGLPFPGVHRHAGGFEQREGNSRRRGVRARVRRQPGFPRNVRLVRSWWPAHRSRPLTSLKAGKQGPLSTSAAACTTRSLPGPRGSATSTTRCSPSCCFCHGEGGWLYRHRCPSRRRRAGRVLRYG